MGGGIGVLLLSMTSSGFALAPAGATGADTTEADTTEADTTDTTRATELLIGYEALLERYRSLERIDSLEVEMTEAGDPVLGINGLVVDQTRTRLGRDFYDLFYRAWEAPESTVPYTVTISEQPALGRGTLVAVLVSGETVFRARLQPRAEYIERAARAAIYYTRRHLQQQAVGPLGY